MRTAIGIVVIVGLIAVVGNLLGGDGAKPGQEPDEPVAVSFETDVAGYTNAGTALKPQRARAGKIKPEGTEIKQMLDDWYQRGWVDVANFGDGTFPEVAGYFAGDARTTFTRDINSLTIGQGRADVTRVEPAEATADISIYLEDGDKPTFATADVRFVAVATPKRKGARPIDIEQTAVLHLEKTDDGWRVSYYEAKQTQEEREPPTPTASPS